MNLRIRTFSMALIAMSAASQVYALPSDESENKEKKEERNVMLNASDANKPREIQIGLPSEDVTVYENGLPAVYSSSVHKLSAHWRSDASLKGTDLMTPSESAIATGNIAYAVSSFSELGQKEFKGKLNYKANHFGMQNVDLNLSGGIGDNWLYTASMYQNFDPGSFKLRFTDYADRTQLYHFGITRILNDGKGRISLLYKYSNSKNPGNFANAAPFIYSGDGSIKKIDGFDPGMDSYVQRQGSFQYLNTKSGKMETWNMSDGSENHANEIALISQYQFDNGWLWKFNAKYMNAVKNYDSMKPMILEGDQYRLVSPYEGNHCAINYVSKDKQRAVLFAYDLHPRYKEPVMNVKMQGLDADKVYTIKETNLMPGKESDLECNGKQYSGDYLMKVGLRRMD
jgi:hypothetical protein